MSHHYSGPNFAFPHGDARLDYTDLFAFPKPGDPSKSILILDVHPSVGVTPPGPTTAEPFAPEALYELKIDTDGDSSPYRIPGAPVRAGADSDAAPPGGRTGRRDGRGRGGDLRWSAGLDGAGGSGDASRRLSLLRRLAQRSFLL